jgi:uncharacterized membrane protein (Fun14 family)
MVESKEESDPMAAAIEKLKPLATQVSFGSIMGFCSGYALKKAGKVAAIIIGTGFVALQTASSYGYIKMDWKKISDDAMKPLDTVSEVFMAFPPDLSIFACVLCLWEYIRPSKIFCFAKKRRCATAQRSCPEFELS